MIPMTAEVRHQIITAAIQQLRPADAEAEAAVRLAIVDAIKDPHDLMSLLDVFLRVMAAVSGAACLAMGDPSLQHDGRIA